MKRSDSPKDMKRSQKSKPPSRSTGAPSFGGFSGLGPSESRSSLSYLTEPPAFGALTDPNVIVFFKNLLKKDPTTKTKALEDLVSHARAHPFEQNGGVEDAVLDVWVQLFPRTSIDNARRVRELSFTLQFELMSSARKRMERHIPDLVGAWLAGIYDRDRVVARAANDGLSSFLNSPEKTLAFWRKCQAQILDYAIAAVQETQDTLSDERSTTKEDAEAKFFRVISSSLSLVLSLFHQLENKDIEKQRSRYDDFFSEDIVWKSITLEDAPVRKITCQLLFACLDRKLPYATELKARQAFVTGGLKTNQTGSALEFVRALTKLAESCPDIWKSSGEKKSPVTRLQAFIAVGSQGSSSRYWEILFPLIGTLPSPATASDASALLDSVRSGVVHREEPRSNASLAWRCYVDVAKHLLRSLDGKERLALAQKKLFPLFGDFMFPVPGSVTISTLKDDALPLLLDLYKDIIKDEDLRSEFRGELMNWSGVFCHELSTCSPSSSGLDSTFDSSQSKFANEGRLWFSFVGKVHEWEKSDGTRSPSKAILVQCLSILESHKLKPFGVVCIMEQSLKLVPDLFDFDLDRSLWARLYDVLFSAAKDEINELVTSPALEYLISLIFLLGDPPAKHLQFSHLWNACVSSLLSSPPHTAYNSVLTSLISHEKGTELARQRQDLQDAIVERTLATVKNDCDSWDLLSATVRSTILGQSAYQALYMGLIPLLDMETEVSINALRALEILIKGEPKMFSAHIQLHTSLFEKLLSLSEIGNDSVDSMLETLRSLLDTEPGGKLPVAEIIQSNLDKANEQSLEIETVVNQAKDASNVSLEEIFPSTIIWIQELKKLIERPVNSSLSITCSIGGAVALVHGIKTEEYPCIQRDRQGRSVPVRMALYLVKFLTGQRILASLPQQFQTELLYLLLVTVHLVSDQVSLKETGGPWETLDPEAVSEAEELISLSRSIIKTEIIQGSKTRSAVFDNLVGLALSQANGLSPLHMYSSRALAELIQVSVEAHGLDASLQHKLLTPELLKSTPETALIAAAVISAFGEAAQQSRLVNTFCNHLVSDLVGGSLDSYKTAISLALFSLTGQVYAQGELPVANNRTVFAVRQLTSWMEDPALSSNVPLCAEVCRALTQLLPCMKDVYGQYWGKTIDFCLKLWHRMRTDPLEQLLPAVHASLRLFKVLENLSEPNDDLKDALAEASGRRSEALMDLLTCGREVSSQQIEIVDSMICREIDKLSVKDMEDFRKFFYIVASKFKAIQTAGFNLLHRLIPYQHQQLSVDMLLDKKDARLPDELVSLLSDMPSPQTWDAHELSDFPSQLRCTLLGWKLVFDALEASSPKIRNDYAEHLKEEDCLYHLLNFIFEVFGITRGHGLHLETAGLDSSKIKDYDIQVADSEPAEKNMQWLLVHLFYLSMKFLPGHFRSHCSSTSKYDKMSLEPWTAKYFSPLVMEETLDEVQAWADSQEVSEDEKELIIKISRPAREITAGYEIDESKASIVIKLPAAYPMESVTVSSLNRVAVTERKWQSWLLTTKGVITLSNGTIIDGLQVFKRNIAGALKGQGECAICYSIISTDKKMPDKRCTTCKNLFHRSCLYKWFQTSSQNTCPLCRNPIDYLGADTQKRKTRYQY